MNTVHTVDSKRPIPAEPGGDRARQIARVTWVGVAVNIILTVFKAAGAFLAGSRALLADAVHSLSDLATDAAVLIGVRYWTAPADREHPYGHQKIETLITLAIGLALVGVGLGLGIEAVRNLLQAGGSPRNMPGIRGVTWLALGAALLSLVSKEILYRWTAAKGRAIPSSAVLANAWHHRSDALSSIPPAISIGAGALGSHWGYDLWFLDPLGTIAVCLMLFKGAWDVVRPTFSPLLDAGADRRLCLAIKDSVLATPGVLATHKIRTRCLCASEVAVDLHILVDGRISVAAGHELAAAVKYRIMNLSLDGVDTQVVDVIVHVEPNQGGYIPG